jgi:hypothetical protein
MLRDQSWPESLSAQPDYTTSTGTLYSEQKLYFLQGML